VIPFVTDRFMEEILERVRKSAGPPPMRH